MKFFSPSLFLVLLLTTMVAATTFAPAFASPAAPSPPLVGGYVPIKDVHDPYIQEIGRYAMIEYNKRHPNNEPLIFKDVVSGESQVVAGTNYKLILSVRSGELILNYQAIVYDKPWESYRNLTSFNFFPPVVDASPPRVPGGYVPIKDVHDPYVQEIGRYAMIEYNKRHPNDKPLVFKDVVSGETQVVAGTNYKLILSVKSDDLIQKYQVIVYDKPWESYRNLTSFGPPPP